MKKTEEKVKRSDLFRKFFAWTELTEEEFEEQTELSRGFIFRGKRGDSISERSRAIIKRVFNVPIEYWEGKGQLPERINVTIVSEASEQYVSRIEEKEKRIQELLDENTKLKDKIIYLQEELLRFQALARSH